MTLIKHLAGFKQAMENGYISNRVFSPLTVEDYLQRISLFLAVSNEMTFETVRDALRAIPPEHHGKYDKLYKAIVCFAKYLHSEGVPVDPRLVVKRKQLTDELASLKRLALRAPKRLTVNEKDLTTLKLHCQNPFETLILTLLSNTGLRASEACALLRKDIDLKTAIAVVHCGKGRKARKVPLNEAVKGAICAYCMTHTSPGLEKPLFLPLNNYPFNRYHLNQTLKRIGKRAGIEVTPHSLRRAFVTISHAKGVPLDHLRIVCGHSDIKTTMGYLQTEVDAALDSVRNVEI